MRIKEGFILRTIQKDHVVIGEGIEQLDFNKLLSLNNTAAYLWEKAAGHDFTLQDLIGWLTERYDVSDGIAVEDATLWLETLKGHGIIEE